MEKESITITLSGKELRRRKDHSDWKRVDAQSDQDIDYGDIPELSEAFWQNAELLTPASQKKTVTLRLDDDIVHWFKKAGAGYQSRINAVLKAYVHSQDPS